MWPSGPCFDRHARAVISRDSREVALERERHLDVYRVEYLAQWQSSEQRYLDAAIIDRIFEELSDDVRLALERESGAALHIDLSLSRDPSALTVCRLVIVDFEEHFVLHPLASWLPSKSPEGVVDFDDIAAVAVDLALKYGARISLDRFQHVAMEEKIEALLDARGISGLAYAMHAPQVIQTSALSKLERWEFFKRTAAEGRVHALPNDLARRELEFLQLINHSIGAPTSGPVTW
jgi:hypothetical protein